ncbi:DNA cytosine methyltransferase [Lactobacillus delbrueckii subsp. bulgaricus]
MKFIDLFAGIGGFHTGLEKAGHTCVGWVEWDKFARKSYQATYDTDGLYTATDIQKVKGVDLPNADLWTFGSPCTDISLAGRKEGLKGKRSSMFFEIIRCLEERALNKDKATQEKFDFALRYSDDLSKVNWKLVMK